MSCFSLVPQCLQTLNLLTIWGTAHMRVIKQCAACLVLHCRWPTRWRSARAL
jgi:hypothetical protein